MCVYNFLFKSNFTTVVSSYLGVLLKQALITTFIAYAENENIAWLMFWNHATGEVEEKQVLLYNLKVISIRCANQGRVQWTLLQFIS